MRAFIGAALPWVLAGVAVALLCVRAAGKKESDGDCGTEGMCLGMCLGAMLGGALENTGLGLSLGMLLGLAVGLMLKRPGEGSDGQ